MLNIDSDEIEPRTSQNWDPTITVPTKGVDIIHSTSCCNIKVTYALTVSCIIPRTFDLTVDIPIQLANYREEQQTPQSGPPLPYPPPTAGYNPAAMPQPSSLYPHMTDTPECTVPPPAYIYTWVNPLYMIA